MKRVVLLAVAGLAVCAMGCLSPITRRLDETSRQLATVNEQLLVVNQQLAALHEQMTHTNKHLDVMESQLAESNKKLETIERGFKKLPGFGGDKEEK